LKLFISYSHVDEKDIDAFIKHITPLKTKGLIETYYDRKILGGKNFQDKIDNKLEDADIICLFISANFLSSNACMEEKSNALELMKKKGISVVPIILSPCGWLDDSDIFSLLALPTDGKPISKFKDSDEAWNCVYKGLKDIIKNEIKIKQLKITDEFSAFLQNTELLSRAHSQKDKVLLEDIFIYPELSKFDELREYEKKINSNILIKDFYDYSKVLIAGENQSGKTTLCKKIFLELRKRNFIPIYIFDKTYQYHGKIENRILNAYNDQYEMTPMQEIDRQRIVPIIDDFHFAKNKEKHIQDLSVYRHQIIVVDDIFNLNFKDESLINSFNHFKIEEFTPLLRNQLIKKWTQLTDKKNDFDSDENATYKRIDEKTELVNTTLGKIFGKGIMPAHPFFILSIISTYDTFAKPLDQEITSQGYCYQAFIYMYLRKQGVKNDEVDTYINFLTEFAFFFHSKSKNEISSDEFNSFMKSYLDKYNLPVKQDTLLEKLRQSQIIALDNFNNYFFCYQYLYYFFVAKYLAEHTKDNKAVIDNIINNLHKDKNAYITIFVSHHSKNNYILDEIILNAYCLFDKYKPASLSDEELSFFDEQVETIVNAVLPSTKATPEMERNDRLSSQNALEQKNSDVKNDVAIEENDTLARELRRSIKTVEVMGHIIKNRAGSLDKSRIESIFEEAMNVHLRILTSFFEIIRQKEGQQEIIDFISNRLKIFIDNKSEERKKEGKKERKPTNQELEKISKTIFWNMNFLAVYGLIDKIVNSIGSNKLTKIIEAICDKKNTPASYLVKHGILMWYNKNLQVNNIAKKIDEDDFSGIAKKIMNFMIVNHCSMHKIDFKEKQKIEHKFGIPSQKL
jgi:hypothetical protein